jgi:hypothetical protein
MATCLHRRRRSLAAGACFCASAAQSGHVVGWPGERLTGTSHDLCRSPVSSNLNPTLLHRDSQQRREVLRCTHCVRGSRADPSKGTQKRPPRRPGAGEYGSGAQQALRSGSPRAYSQADEHRRIPRAGPRLPELGRRERRRLRDQHPAKPQPKRLSAAPRRLPHDHRQPRPRQDVGGRLGEGVLR